MANEFQIVNQLNVEFTTPQPPYRTQSNFKADSIGSLRGPAPGQIEVDTDGVNVDLSQLDTPGPYRITNRGTTVGNYVEIGLWIASEFWPIHELLPGESYVGRFSRNLGFGFPNAPGTGTSGSGAVIRLKAYSATCNVSLEAFEA